jgi:cyanophycinase
VEMGEPVSIDNLTVHVMSYGDTFDLKTKKLALKEIKKVLKD